MLYIFISKTFIMSLILKAHSRFAAGVRHSRRRCWWRRCGRRTQPILATASSRDRRAATASWAGSLWGLLAWAAASAATASSGARPAPESTNAVIRVRGWAGRFASDGAKPGERKREILAFRIRLNISGFISLLPLRRRLVKNCFLLR